ncbi:Scr1 family TA system antitoxin-like transcriptional regulator [Streptomyces roseolus]|uniref:helix-turn-helix domain-containing protein n=1 Tax=Streptomyces roseolus TaxID=67358 RepID=UPI00379A31D3
MSGKHEERPEKPSESDGTAHLFKALGKIIKVLRTNAGLSQAQLASITHCSEDLISAIERGVRTPQPDFLLLADSALGGTGVLTAAVEDTEKALSRARTRHPDWFQSFAKEEARAVAAHYYEVQAVPGILQTPAYARSLFEHRRPMLDEETIETRIADRISRQALFERWPAPTLTFVLEAAVQLQILPLDGEEHPYLDGAFTLLTPPGRREVAYTEIYGHARLITDPEEVRQHSERYGILRSQALTKRESLTWIEKLLGER